MKMCTEIRVWHIWEYRAHISMFATNYYMKQQKKQQRPSKYINDGATEPHVKEELIVWFMVAPPTQIDFFLFIIRFFFFHFLG